MALRRGALQGPPIRGHGGPLPCSAACSAASGSLAGVLGVLAWRSEGVLAWPMPPTSHEFLGSPMDPRKSWHESPRTS